MITQDDTEQILLGMILRDPQILHIVKQNVDVSDWFIPAHQRIYSCILEYEEKYNEVPTIDEICDKLSMDDTFLGVGGAGYLKSLYLNALPTISDDNVLMYARKLNRNGTIRRIISLGATIQNIATTMQDPDKILDVVDTSLQRLRSLYYSATRNVRFTKLRIVTSNPRAYYLTIDPPGQEIALTLQQIRNPRAVQAIIQNQFDFIPRMPKNWLDVLNDLLQRSEKVPPPQEAVLEYRVKEAVLEFFSRMAPGDTVSDLKGGYMYVVKTFFGEEYRCFYIKTLLKYLDVSENIKLQPFDAWNILSRWGCLKNKHIRLDKTTTVWALPEKFFQTAELDEDISETTDDTTEKTTEDNIISETTDDTTTDTEKTTTDTEIAEETDNDNWDWLFDTAG